jgi:galactokinase
VSALESLFSAAFGAPGPTHRVTVPGRVNLIGDHIDYAGLPVLPMAIQRRETALVRPRDDRTVRLVNADARFTPRSWQLDPDVSPWPAGDWGNYVKAAARHLERRFGAARGFDAAFASQLPIASGLSSSSAMVIAGALCAATAAGLDLNALALAEELAEAERYVGTRGGGMDQAVCLAAEAGAALLVGFDPLAVEPVPIPQSWRFVIASSLVRAEKSSGARAEYNLRREQVEEALAGVSGVLGAAGGVTQSFRDLLARHDAAELIGVAEGALAELPLRRFCHVVTESDRVARAVTALRREDASAFGGLMVESHASLRDDFAVSHAELDAIVDLALSAGAHGARLTGAGFGGSAVILADAGSLDTVMHALREAFYAPRGVAGDLTDELFVAEPSAGASVRELLDAL